MSTSTFNYLRATLAATALSLAALLAVAVLT
jgi:hypothetical protein